MAALERRTAAVELSEPCASCGRPLSEQPPTSAGPSGAAGAGLALRSTVSSTLLNVWHAMLRLSLDQGLQCSRMQAVLIGTLTR
jgi:hypothetical protein